MALNEVLEKTSIGEICIEMIMYLGPVWLGFSMGLIVGWMWKPKWVSFRTDKIVYSLYNSYDSSLPSSSASVVSPIEEFDNASDEKPKPAVSATSSTSSFSKEQSSMVTEEDFRHLWQLVEMKDGGPPWIKMMDRSTETMDYQAWRRDPRTGPPQYRSKTIFEDAKTEIMRDFFWDDVFRANWDDMLAYFKTIEECPSTGTTVAQWILSLFCNDREYIVGCQIWEAGRSYYCLTKGVPCDSVPRRDKPRRVELYYSSWCIRPVESRQGNGQLTACKVLLFHHEEMGIPW